MSKNTMNKAGLVFGILFIALAVIIFVFADGLRRWYSGIFFVVIGTVVLVNVWRSRRVAGQ
jgi:hypothetical protein